MNAISRALAKRDRQRMEVRREAGAESGTDWATTLLFNCLHDKYGFGRNRFAAMNDMWEHLDEFQEGFIYDWRDELCEHGFDRFLNERIAERMQKMITGRTPPAGKKKSKRWAWKPSSKRARRFSRRKTANRSSTRIKSAGSSKRPPDSCSVAREKNSPSTQIKSKLTRKSSTVVSLSNRGKS